MYLNKFLNRSSVREDKTMKIAKGIIALLPLVITAAVLPFMPESVPMHYDINGNIDRMGSRYELLLMPLLIIVIVAVSAFVMKHYAKMAESSDDSQANSAKANRKVLNIITLAVPVVFGALQCGILYMTYRNAQASDISVNSDLIVRLAFILTGVMCVVLGNYMPKTARNHFFGFRVSWSLYNENTWRKCNRMGGIVFMITGLLIIVTAAVVPAIAIVFLSLGYILAATVGLLIYAHKVYKVELAKER